MRTLTAIAVALITLFVSGLALADSIGRQGNDWVRITARPCADDKVLQHIPDAGRRLDFRAATAHFQGQDYAACWAQAAGGVDLVYEDGDTGFVPERDLKPVPEA